MSSKIFGNAWPGRTGILQALGTELGTCRDLDREREVSPSQLLPALGLPARTHLDYEMVGTSFSTIRHDSITRTIWSSTVFCRKGRPLAKRLRSTDDRILCATA